MVIHFYGLCWNEERMLPFFFQHYDAIVDRYFIFDNHSTDSSRQLLEKHPRVELDTFDIEGDSFVEAAKDFYNEAWKHSRDTADWIIIANLDEHLYHPDLRAYLETCSREGISLIVPEGYDMISLRFPKFGRPLWQQVRRGVRADGFDKPELFAPGKIEETNFVIGRHRASPTGEVKKPAVTEVFLLHFKCLGLPYIMGRHNELRSRMRIGDILQNFGFEYSYTNFQRLDFFLRRLYRSKRVLPPSAFSSK